MTPRREYPEHPVVGVGGVLIDDGRVLLVRRASPPLQGAWSIPGGMLELGETLEEGVRRELAEETGLDVSVLELIEAVDRIDYAPGRSGGDGVDGVRDGIRPQFHYVVLDYLCSLRTVSVQSKPLAEVSSEVAASHVAAVQEGASHVATENDGALHTGPGRAGSDAADVAWAREDELPGFALTPLALRVVRKAFSRSRERS